MGSQRIDEFVQFFLRLKPQFETVMKGASQADIHALQELAGMEFCASYRRFLHYFGRTKSGVLNPFLYDSSFSVDDAAEFYQELKEPEVDVSIPDQVMFWLHGRREFDWLLRQPTDPDGDPQVVVADIYGSEQPPSVQVLFASFEKTLFNDAFNKLRLRSFDYQQSLLVPNSSYNPDPMMKRAHEIALRLGFTCIPQSVGVEAAYDRTDAALSVGRAFPADHFSCWIGTNNERETKHIVQIFCDNLGGYTKPVR